MNTTEKEEFFRKNFYSNLTEAEIKNILDIDYKEYKRLLNKTKAYYQLPSSYRRLPNIYGKYTKDSYYILKFNKEDFTIIGYYPLFKFAETELLSLEKNNIGDDKFYIEKATDDNLMEIIKYGYITLGWNWEKLQRKCKLPYGVFYKLFNKVKKRHGLNRNNPYRYIYRIGDDEYKVIKTLNGKQVSFGVYTDREYAVGVRDYLESIGWDKEIWLDTGRFKFIK